MPEGQVATKGTYFDYPDDGCQFSPECLDCSMPICKDDEKFGAVRLKKLIRDGEIIKFYRKGYSFARLSLTFGLSERTIRRVVERQREYDNRKF